MRLILRMFSAFCVATVLAQGCILALASMRGNLHTDTFAKAMALLNGIDISGDRLQRMLKESRDEPVPTYEDVRDARAKESKNLQMREDSVKRMYVQTTEMLAELKTKTADFDRRKDEFYKLLEEKETTLLDESLKEVQRTIEALSPEQAKQQLLKLLDSDHEDDVVAIVKEMPIDKRKKILGEFTANDEAEKLHRILTLIRAGEPAADVIQDARNKNQQSE